MSGMKIDLDADMMAKLFQQAVLDSMTPEKRAEVIARGIKSLFEPSEYGYGGKKQSPLEQIFSQASTDVARQIVRAEMEKPENQKIIEDMVVEGFRKMLSDTGRRDKAIDRIADALTDALVAKEYR